MRHGQEWSAQQHSFLERQESVLLSKATRFDELIEVAGLDTTRDLRFANWSGVDMSGCNLSGCDFTGALLDRCQFSNAIIAGARFDGAHLDRAALRKAADWRSHVAHWRKADRVPSLAALPDLACFSDAPVAPEMVVIPEGRFLMGSPEGEEGRDDDEGPQHEVTIAYRFALARYPVTFAEFEAFCAATGRKPPEDEKWGRGPLPVINVSWEDAQAYCAWLSSLTGADYRLPSESEWEYACRAGTATAWPWGGEWEPRQANGRDGGPGRTTAVGSYPANGWGLYDMIGNVLEWVADSWLGDYQDARGDGSARDGGRLGKRAGRVVCGGSWGNRPGNCRAAGRLRVGPDGGGNGLGFRPARTLLPSSS